MFYSRDQVHTFYNIIFGVAIFFQRNVGTAVIWFIKNIDT